LPFFGPLSLSAPLAAGDPRIQQFAQQLRQAYPGLTGLTTYPGPYGGGASAFGFSTAYNPFQGAIPTTLDQALQVTQPITDPSHGVIPESLTGVLAQGVPGRADFGGGPSGGGPEAGGMPGTTGDPGGGVSAGLTTPLGTIGGNAQGFGVQSQSSGLVGQGLNAALGVEGNPTLSAGTLANAAMSAAPLGLGLVNTAAGMLSTNIQNQRTVAALNEMVKGLNVATAPMGGMPTAGPGLAAEVSQGLAPPSDIMNPNAIGAPPGTPAAPGSSAMDAVAAQIGAAAAAGNVGVSDATTAPGVVGPASVEAAVSAGVGGGAGAGGGDGTVLCTEFHRRGWMTDAAYLQDCAYGHTLPPNVIRGYHAWAIPLVRAMRRSTAFARLIHLLCRPWLQAMAGTPTGLSRFYLALGLPLCAWLGKETSDDEVLAESGGRGGGALGRLC